MCLYVGMRVTSVPLCASVSMDAAHSSVCMCVCVCVCVWLWVSDCVSLHVWQRTYPDGDMHKEIMRRPGGAKSEEELQRLVNLPPGDENT